MTMTEVNIERRRPAEAFPPGEYLQVELDARGISMAIFSAAIGREPGTLKRLIDGKAQLTADLALDLEESLGLDAQYWLNLESAYRLAKSRQRRCGQRRVAH